MDVSSTIAEITTLIVNESVNIGKPILASEFTIIHQPKGQKPLKLPDGKMTVYTFIYNDKFLKVGQAQYNPRYQSHHYHIRSGKSTLANSLIKDSAMSTIVNEDNVTDWVRNNCERFDVLIDAKLGKITLNFIEGLLQYKYQPKYEG
jgi:hypothetical protein